MIAGLGCQAGLTPDRPLRLVGSFVSRLRAELTGDVLSQADEAYGQQAEGDLMLAVRFWRQVVDLEDVSPELRDLIGQRVQQLQLWVCRQMAMQHLQRGRMHGPPSGGCEVGYLIDGRRNGCWPMTHRRHRCWCN